MNFVWRRCKICGHKFSSDKEICSNCEQEKKPKKQKSKAKHTPYKQSEFEKTIIVAPNYDDET